MKTSGQQLRCDFRAYRIPRSVYEHSEHVCRQHTILKMEKREWSRSHIEYLISLYEELPSLWDVSSAHYRDGVKKAEDWKHIAVTLGREIEEIRRKMHNLRNQFSQELKKCRDHKSGQGTGRSYHSKWLYFDSLKFIKGGMVSRKSTGKLIQENNTPADTIEETASSRFPNDSVDITIIQPRYIPTPQNETRKSCKRKMTKSQDNDAISMTPCTTIPQPDDAYDIFGSFVASELRSLKKESNKKRLKRIIQRAIIEVAEDDDDDY